jgi:hypothetical protein
MAAVSYHENKNKKKLMKNWKMFITENEVFSKRKRQHLQSCGA